MLSLVNKHVYMEIQRDEYMKSSKLGLPIEYQQFPEFFDIPSNDYNIDQKNKVIETLLSKYKSKNVFDMTCGTGAQTLYLANLGYNVIGSDFSPQLLKIARDKAAKQNLNIRFIDGDMRDLQLGEFDAVITIDNAIGHLVKDDFEIAIRNIYKNLKTGGIYIFDILNLDAMTDEIIESDSKKMSNTAITADGSVISNVRQTTINRDKGYLTSDENITILKDGKQTQIKNRCSLQIYTMDELIAILSRNGFKTIEQYKIDTYSFQQDPNGYGILTVAQKQ